ncbi:MAG: CubicO group peptidase (beta-lactamase class C family) [Haloarculaceae archaeon]|jgi:CubicO group peptidase (beta-lactamase class C family)
MTDTPMPSDEKSASNRRPVNRRRFLRATAVGTAVLTAPAGLGAAANQAEKPPLPVESDGFEETSPSGVEMDPETTRRAIDYATTRNAASLRVYRHNQLVGTSRLDPVTAEVQNNVWSTTKGVVSMLAGRAVELGHLDVGDRIGKYIPFADAAHSRITIEQLLTQSSGLPLNWSAELSQPPDTVRYTLGLDIEDEPGTDFEYGQTTCTVLAYAIEQAVGEDLQRFAQKQLFGPLGIERDDWFWLRDRAGNTHGYAYLYIRPTDLARLGHVMLRNGQWRNQQLLDSSYVERASAPSDTNPYYGYLFWINQSDHGYTVDMPDQKFIRDRRLVESAPRDMYAFVGFLDQIIFVIPSLDMVVIRTGFPGNYQLDPQELITAHPGRWMHEFFRILMRAVEDVDVPDPGPYRNETDLEFDYNYFVDADENAAALGLGPEAPEGCTVLGCESPVASEGYVQFGRDAARTALGNIDDSMGSGLLGF